MAKSVSAAEVLLIILSLSCDLAFAQPVPTPSGHWEGAIEVPGQELKIEIDLAGKGDTWEGTISVPAQSLKGFPLAAISVKGDSVSFAMKGVPGDPTFTGTLKDGKTLSGMFSQGGGSVPFALTRTGEAKIEPLPKSTPITKDLEGSWEGPLDIDGKILRLVLKLSNQSSGLGGGTLISVDQGGVEIPIGTIIQSGATVKILVPTVLGTYEGELKDAQLTGKWTQGPRTWPLVFKRSK